MTVQDFVPNDLIQQRRKSEFLNIGCEAMLDRDYLQPGHFTASAFIRTKDFSHVALIFHPRFQKWIQPGGHLDSSDVDILSAARREAEEEIGISDLRFSGFLRLDVHDVPTTVKNGAHQHWDIQFGFIAPYQELSGDVSGKWLKWEELPSFSHNTDRSVMTFLEAWYESFFEIPATTSSYD